MSTPPTPPTQPVNAQPAKESRKRVRDYGILIGDLPTGALNAITDVEGVLVGHTTLIEGHGRLERGSGPIRTGVTVIRPHDGNLFRHKVHGAVHAINGFGKPVGFEQVRELGVIESPIALTNTLNVGLVTDALVEYSIRANPEIGVRIGSVNVVVGECNDCNLNDLQGRHVKSEHVLSALERAGSGPVAEGAVGAGTGTSSYGWKAGIGTASRVIPAELGGFTIGILVQSNFGVPRDFMLAGVPVGKHVLSPAAPPMYEPPVPHGGSIMVVLATDAPIHERQLRRLSVRAGAGLARTGSHYAHDSGDFVIAFSTAQRIDHYPPLPTLMHRVLAYEARMIEVLFAAVAEATEEAVLNSMFAAETMTGRDNITSPGLPIPEVLDVLKRYGRGV